jgi:hypothetical protein
MRRGTATMSIDMLHCFPGDDASFRACAEALLKSSALDEPRELQKQLRRVYPRAVVRKQHSLAAMSDRERVWYVYRDGQYMTPKDEDMAVPVDAA